MTFTSTLLARDVLCLSGHDTRDLLQGLVSVDMNRLSEGGGSLYGALLTPQGKIVETMFFTPLQEKLYIDVPAGRGTGLLRKLMLYRLRAKVKIEDLSGKVLIGVAPNMDSLPTMMAGASPDPRHEALGYRFHTSSPEGIPSTEDQYLAYQLALGLVDMCAGFETSEVFPLDVNLDAVHGIDHKKGCFVGQEVASRMFRKGEIRKRTYIAKGEKIAAGSPLKQGERTVGEIRLAIGETGLAIVRLDRLKSDAAEADGTPVTLIKPDYLS